MNQLTVSLQHSIPTLAARGWAARKIARQLGIHRETVGRYLHPRAPGPDSKPAISTPGSVAGRTSLCAPWAELIERGLLAGLSAQRIHQDLVSNPRIMGHPRDEGPPLDMSTPPSESLEREEMVVLIGQGIDGRHQTLMLPIVRLDNGRFWNLGDAQEMGAEGFQGRFAGLLPPKPVDEKKKAMGRALLEAMGVKVQAMPRP